MFRFCSSQGSRTALWNTTSTSAFHSSASASAAPKRASIARATKKLNNTRKAERLQHAQATRPHVVLGTRPGDESKWENCDLRKGLVDVNELTSSTELQPTKQSVGTINLPKQVGFGVGEAEKKILFEDLPVLGTQTHTIRQSFDKLASQHDKVAAARRLAESQMKELAKANAFAKLLDLRNANAGGVAFENRRRIIAEFSEPSNPFDPGRTEVQAALITYKIHNLWTHLTTFKRDVGNRRGLRKLVHQRAKILKYLKKEDQNRYERLLPRLGLEPGAVEGELVV